MDTVPTEHVVRLCRGILKKSKDADIAARVAKVEIGLGNFLDISDCVRDVILNEWSTAQRRMPVWVDFAWKLRKLRDNLEDMVAQDPMIMYNPGIPQTFAFHQSLAKIRYFHSGNRCRKSQTAAGDNYYVLTGSHPWRPMPPQPTSVVVVGPDYSTYCPEVFEKKYIIGETGNILSPIFPPDGKWFHSYNASTKQLKLACRKCAEAGEAQSCRHPKATLSFASGDGKVKAISGGQHGQVQFDEQVPEEFKNEALERLKTVPNSSFIVTETPLMGEAFWTYDLKVLSESPSNIIPSTGKPYVECFCVSQYEGGLVDFDEIEASKLSMTDEEIAVRIYGKHVSFGANKVFDLAQINRYQHDLHEPKRGSLSMGETSMENLRSKLMDIDPYRKDHEFTFMPDEEGLYYIYDEPDPTSQYLVAVDTAAGLAGGDASIARVWELIPHDETTIGLRDVAKFSGQVNPVPFALHIYKLALRYNGAQIVVERNHAGVATIFELVTALNCPLLYRKQSHLAQVQYAEDRVYGVDTSVTSKPAMIAHAQSMVYSRATAKSLVETHDKELVKQLQYYIQEVTESGFTVRYKGQGKMHDDEVQTLLLAALVVRTSPHIYDWSLHHKLRMATQVRTFTSRDEKYKWAMTQLARGKKTGLAHFDSVYAEDTEDFAI